MPWHKVRVFYDREAQARRRFEYHVKVSVLIAGAVLLIAMAIGIYPLVELLFSSSLHGPGTGGPWHIRPDIPDLPTYTQEVCVCIAVACFLYISIALNTRTRR